MIKEIILNLVYELISLTAGTTTFILGISAIHYFVSISTGLEPYILFWFLFGVLILSFVSYGMTIKLLREE